MTLSEYAKTIVPILGTRAPNEAERQWHAEVCQGRFATESPGIRFCVVPGIQTPRPSFRRYDAGPNPVAIPPSITHYETAHHASIPQLDGTRLRVDDYSYSYTEPSGFENRAPTCGVSFGEIYDRYIASQQGAP